MITLTNLATVAILLITLGAYLVQRSAINRARTYKLGRKDALRERDESSGQVVTERTSVEKAELDQLLERLEAANTAGPALEKLIAQIAARSRDVRASGLAPAGWTSLYSQASSAVTPPVIPQKPTRFEEGARRSEQTNKD